jgi:hypothetical protein
MSTLETALVLASVIVTALIAFIPLVGMHHGMLKFSLFSLLPPSNLYRKATYALKELGFLDKKGVDQSGDEYWYSTLNSKEKQREY